MRSDRVPDTRPDKVANRPDAATDIWDGGVQLETCPEFERILVETQNTPYELIVVHGEDGQVLVRGGTHFPEFQPAMVAGATAGGSWVKLTGIYLGLRMELHARHKVIITSPVQRIWRTSPSSRS